MSAQPLLRKPCYKCGNFAEVGVAEFHNGQKNTTCPVCKDKLQVVWDQAVADAARRQQEYDEAKARKKQETAA